MPPAASRQGAVGHRGEPASAGYWNPNGGVLVVPRTNSGGVEVPATKFVDISPGGLPRNCSCMLAKESASVYMPNPPCKTQAPDPVISQATPTRGLYPCGEKSSA